MKFKDTAPEAQDYPRALGADTAAVLKDLLDLSGGRNRGTGAQQSRYRARFPTGLGQRRAIENHAARMRAAIRQSVPIRLSFKNKMTNLKMVWS